MRPLRKDVYFGVFLTDVAPLCQAHISGVGLSTMSYGPCHIYRQAVQSSLCREALRGGYSPLSLWRPMGKGVLPDESNLV